MTKSAIMKLPKMGQAAPGNYLLYDQMLDEIEKGLNDAVSIDVSAGGTFTLTETQATQSLIVELTGTPAAAFTVQYAAGQKRVQVFLNSTAQNATIQTATGGSSGVVLSPHTGDLLCSDGTDVKAYLSMDVLRLATASMDPTNDYVPFWDASAGALAKILGENLPGTGGGGGTGGGVPYKGALVHHSVNQSIATGSATALAFDTEDFDTDAIHDVVTNNSRLTVPSGVTKVVLRGGALFAADAGSTLRSLQIRKNGAAISGSPLLQINSHGENIALSVASPVLVVSAGDYFELFARQDSGGALNVETSNFTYFEMTAVEAAAPNADVRGALVKRTTDQSIPNNSFTAVAWDGETYDTDSIHDTATNNSRLTVPAGVTKIRLTSNITFDFNANGTRQAEILKNGSAINADGGARVHIGNQGTLPSFLNLDTAVLDVTPGDYFEIQVWQNSGGALGLASASETWFAMQIVETKIIRPIHRGALVRKSANQSIPNNAATPVTFDQEEYDTDAFHDVVTNNSRMTVPAGVTKIRLAGGAIYASNSTGVRELWFEKNGASFVGAARTRIDATSGQKDILVTHSPVIAVSPGDYFELVANQASGAALNIEAADWTYFSLEVVE